MSEHKKKAWYVTAFLLSIVLIWSVFAVHESAVAAARAARAGSVGGSAGGGCPFSTKSADAQVKKSCCHSNASAANIKAPETETETESSAKPDFKKFADLSEAELEEFKKRFTPEQLAKCPHFNKLKPQRKNKKNKDKRK